MTSLIRTLVVDDEGPSRLNLRMALGAFPGWTLMGECSSVSQARALLETDVPDVIFLDIQMPKESGISLARTLSAWEDPPILIFVTAFDDYAIEAFQVHALDYLLKPFDDQRFALTIARAESLVRLKQQGTYGRALQDYVAGQPGGESTRKPPYLERFMVRSTGRIDVVPAQDVLWIGSSGNYVELHTATRVILHRIAMSKLERHLDPDLFIRVHRTAFVRRDQIAALEATGPETYTLTLRMGGQVPVSPRHLKAIRAVLA